MWAHTSLNLLNMSWVSGALVHWTQYSFFQIQADAILEIQTNAYLDIHADATFEIQAGAT